MKKILALALALIMVLGLATTVSAETISTESSDTHSYKVYQIFKGTVEEGKLVEVTRGQNSSLANEDGVAAALAALEAANGKTDAEKLDVILNYVNLDSTPYGTVAKDAPLTAEPGYYLLKDQGPLAENESYSLYIVKVVKDVEISPKRGTIIPEKKVDDVNDSDAKPEYNVKNEDSADYDIGDSVPFTLSATLPENYADFSVYKLVFHDKMEAGLTFKPETVKVYLNSVAEANLIADTKYELITEADKLAAHEDGKCTFEIDFDDLKVSVPTAAAGSKIIVKFEARLNEQASVGADGNSNEMYLEYINNPNWVPDPDAETPPPPPTEETPKDKVVVFTYKVVVDKKDENGEELSGATFELFKWDLAANEGQGAWVSKGKIEGDDKTQFTWNGVDDGKYKLVEVDAPSGYNKIEDIEFTITATHTEDGAEPVLTELKADAPFTADATSGAVSADIENLPGAVLPGTGGIGTTIFYIVGGLLVAAAVVLLVTKKRMATAE